MPLTACNAMIRSHEDTTIAEGDIEFARSLKGKLLGTLRGILPQSENSDIILAAYNDNEKTTGGLVASTSYSWLLIKILWIDESCRHQGLGRKLVHMAEQRSIERGCHNAWLDTSNPDAMKFYQRLGYEEFGLLSNSPDQAPANHHRWFMKKTLKQD